MSDVIAVIGAGQMGNGIAHVCAAAGIPVTMIDVSAEALAKAKATIEKNFDRQIKKGAIDVAARDAALSKLSTSTDLGAVSTATVVIDAATENVPLKLQHFRTPEQLD